MMIRLKSSGVAAGIVFGMIALIAFLWPPVTPDVSPLIRPEAVEPGPAVPVVVVSVAQGQVVGAEAYFKGFRLESGWSLVQAGDYGRYTLDAKVTNISDLTATARLQVSIRVGERNVETLMCRVEVEPGKTLPIICADTHHAAYTSRWGRITITAV